LISEATGSELFVARRESSFAARLSRVLSVTVYAALIAITVLSLVPYGSAEFWWKAVFVCCVFATAVLWVVDSVVTDSWAVPGGSILLPGIALAVFAWLQSIAFGNAAIAAISGPVGKTISADPFSTRFFVLQLAALILLAAMLYRYANTELRLRTLSNIIIGVAVISALYGILRQTAQHSIGFGLPLLKPDQGYGQFINRNHFAFLMEMGFGLALGIILGGGVKRDRGLIYLGALLPIWSGLVLSNSRGGILAMLAQIVSAALLFTFVGRPTITRFESTTARLVRSVPARAAMLLVLVVSVAVGTLWLGGDRLATKLEQANQEFDPVAAELRQNARRNQIWRATWRMFTAHPIAGVGIGGYWMAIPAFHDASGVMTPQEAHNDYLELLASGGLIGFSVGIWFVILLYRRIRENLRAANRFRSAACFGAALGILGVAVHSLVDFGLHTFANALVFTSLIVIATAISAGKAPELND
jgi:O-antigen ligase